MQAAAANTTTDSPAGHGRDNTPQNPAAPRARWDSLPADPAAVWHVVNMRSAPLRVLDDMFTDSHMLAIGDPKYIPKHKPASNQSGHGLTHAEKIRALSEDSVRQMYAKAAPIVAAGRLATEIRGSTPSLDVDYDFAALLTPAGHWLPACKRMVSWFKRAFPGCSFYLGDEDQGLVAITHPDYVEPVGLIAAAGKTHFELPADGASCEFSMPANAPIAKPYRAPAKKRPASAPKRRTRPRAVVAQAKDIIARLEAMAQDAPFCEYETSVIITCGNATWRVHHEQQTLLHFIKRFKKCCPMLDGPVSISVTAPPSFTARLCQMEPEEIDSALAAATDAMLAEVLQSPEIHESWRDRWAGIIGKETDRRKAQADKRRHDQQGREMVQRKAQTVAALASRPEIPDAAYAMPPAMYAHPGKSILEGSPHTVPIRFTTGGMVYDFCQDTRGKSAPCGRPTPPPSSATVSTCGHPPLDATAPNRQTAFRRPRISTNHLPKTPGHLRSGRGATFRPALAHARGQGPTPAPWRLAIASGSLAPPPRPGRVGSRLLATSGRIKRPKHRAMPRAPVPAGVPPGRAKHKNINLA